MRILNFLLVSYLILKPVSSSNATEKKCVLPAGCEFGWFHFINNYLASEFVSRWDYRAFICHINNASYLFDLDTFVSTNQSSVCNRENFAISLDLRFAPKMRNKLILNRNLNLQNVIDFLFIFGNIFYLHLTNLGGYSVDLGIWVNVWKINPTLVNPKYINFVRNRVEFYSSSGKLVKSCRDLNSTREVNSIFQITPNNQYPEMMFYRCEFR